MVEEFRYNVLSNRDALLAALKRSPNLAYQKVNELALFVGSRYGVEMQLHFPVAAKISDVDAYGTENVGVIVDKFRRVFPVPRDKVKQKAVELLGAGARPQDAYMYEGKEGVKVLLPVAAPKVSISGGMAAGDGSSGGGRGGSSNNNSSRIEVLPGSVHFWCKLDESVKAYGDWLVQNVYFPDAPPAQNSDEKAP